MKIFLILSLAGILHSADVVDMYLMPGSEVYAKDLKIEISKIVNPKLYTINWADISNTPNTKGTLCAYIMCNKIAEPHNVLSLSLTIQNYGTNVKSLEIGLSKTTSEKEIASDIVALANDVFEIAFSNIDKVTKR